jgi:hypothetical protein
VKHPHFYTKAIHLKHAHIFEFVILLIVGFHAESRKRTTCSQFSQSFLGKVLSRHKNSENVNFAITYINRDTNKAFNSTAFAAKNKKYAI